MNNINLIKTLKKNFLQKIALSKYINQSIIFSLRLLEESDRKKEELQKRQLNELFIYLVILFGIIILILCGYNVYKKCVKNNATREVNLEYEYYNNIFHNSISAASQDERNVYSLNGKVFNKYKVSELESYNDPNQNNNSFDYNHEERMEKIRKKYGNKMLIKILINQQIENVIYDKNLGYEYGDKCTICFNNFIDNLEIYRTPCEHIFHKDCFNKYLKKINKKSKITCPNCNQNLLLNKKFFKLRKEIKICEVKNKFTDKKNIFNFNNNFETEKKQIMDVSTGDNNKNGEIVTVKNNADHDTIANKNVDTIFVLKKRKIESNRNKIFKHAATVDHNKKIYIYNPNPSIQFNKIKNDKKEEEEMYIPNIDENDVEILKETINNLNKGNNKKNDPNLLNINLKDKKKKVHHGKIKFSDMENEMNNNQINSQDFNSNRELSENKMIFSNAD